MLKKMLQEIMSAVDKVKWFVSLVIERIKIEIAVIRVLGKSERFERERKEILMTIGARIAELSGRKRVNVFEDPDVKEALVQLEKLERSLQLLRKEAEDITTLEV